MTEPGKQNLPNDEPASGHEPVLLAETLELLDLRPGQTVADCTTGRGGHAEAIAKILGPAGLLLALDADPRNLEFARSRLADAPCRIRFFHANFAELSDVLDHAEVGALNAVLADLGLSTNQFFDPQYGMSFSAAMPLDMRIDPRTDVTAADLVNRLPEIELANVLYKNAQEHWSRRISRKIAEARSVSPIMTTDRLADLVRSAVPSRGGAPAKIDPATRTFLALRMEVNRELPNLQALLERAPGHLRPGGRLAVISFHSTEDRMVKRAFRSAQETGAMRVLTARPVCPADEEIARNPRSRSAKLRAAQRE